MGECAAFRIGPVVFHWYGVLITVAIVAGLLVALWQARRCGDNRETVYDLALVSIPAGIVFARLYYVFTHWSVYANNITEIPAIWHGGLSFNGALLGAWLACWLYTRITEQNFWRWADICIPGVLVGQALGRWASFINQESFGYPTTSQWGIYIDYNLRPPGYESYDYFTPVVLYDFIWDVLTLLIVVVAAKLRQRYFPLTGNGGLFLIYVVCYVLGRVIIGPLHLDSGSVNLVSPAFVVGGLVLVVCLIGIIMVWQKYHYRRSNITL